MHFFPTLNAETQTALHTQEKHAATQRQGVHGPGAKSGSAVLEPAAAKQSVAESGPKAVNVAAINNLRQPSLTQQKQAVQAAQQQHQQQLQLQQRQVQHQVYPMQVPRGELALGVAAMWPFWSAVAQQQEMLGSPSRVPPQDGALRYNQYAVTGVTPEHGEQSSSNNSRVENKHFTMKLNSAIGHLLHKQELAQPASQQKMRSKAARRRRNRHSKDFVDGNTADDDYDDGADMYERGEVELDPTSGYDAWSQSSRNLRSMEDDDISDPGDPEDFLERADKKEVERNRCKLAEFLRRERICAQQMLECHETFRRSECDARVESIERVCGKEIYEVQCQIESLKHKLLALEQQRDEMMADTTSTYLEMGQRLRKDTERVAKAQRKLRACAGQDYITARANVASVMAFCKKRIDRTADTGRAPVSGAPISVGPEVPALRSEAAEDSVEAVLKAAKDAQATGKEFLHADAAMQRWILTGLRPSTKDVVRWLRTNAKLATALGDRLLDLADQSNEMDFFDKVETFARKCSLLVFDGAADTLNEKPSENDDAGSSDSEPAQGREHSIERKSKKRRHETAGAYSRDIF